MFCLHCNYEQITDDGEPVKHLCKECSNDEWYTFDKDEYTTLHDWYFNIELREQDV